MSGKLAPVLLIDPTPAVRRGWARWLLEHGVEALTAADLQGAPVLVPGRDPLVLVSERTALEVVPTAYTRRVLDRATLIVTTDPGEPALTEVAGLRVFAQLTRGDEPPSGLLVAVTRARELAVGRDNAAAPPAVGAGLRPGDPVASDSATRAVFARARKLAGLHTPALIVGEVGSGRRTVAQQLFAGASKPVRVLPCDELAALAPELADAELGRGLGDEAISALLLLELEALPATLQARLQSRLREGPRIGPRLVSIATPRLREAVKAGTFSRSLFHALATHALDVPPLRDRKDDIPVLLHLHAKAYAERAGVALRPFTTDLVRALRNFDWPGNVPELFAAVEGALSGAASPTLTRADFPLLPRRPPDPRSAVPIAPLSEIKKDAAIAIERAYVDNVLAETGGNVSLAAHLASMDRANFRRASKHGELARLRHPRVLAKLLSEAARVARRAADDDDER